MGKYDAELNLSVRTSLSIILQRLKPGGRVLELGPANGRLTRYMAQELRCTVDIVEIDAEAGAEAAAFADIACLGPVEGNIDEGHWLRRIEGNQYDYVVCADVLEHLRNPGKVLGDCLGLLKKGGSLIASVPNIAHNAVLISLLSGYFDYRNLGLLDNTHIHFFTRLSFRNMARQQGYKVVYETATYADAWETELGVDYSQVGREAARVLKCRPDGTAYQYVFELQGSAEAAGQQEISDFAPWSPYFCECFPLAAGQQDFTPQKRCVQQVEPRQGGRLRFSFDLSSFGSLKQVRIDPLNTNCMLRLLQLELVYEQGARPIGKFAVNGIHAGSLLIFADEDPQLLLEVEEPAGLLGIRGEFELISFDDEQIPKVAELAKEAGLLPENGNRAQELEKLGAGLTRRQLLKLLAKTFI